MNKLLCIFILAVLVLVNFNIAFADNEYDVSQISFTGTENWYPDINNQGEIVWSSVLSSSIPIDI